MLFRLRDEATMPWDALEPGNRLAEFHSVSRPADRLSLKKPESLALLSMRCGGPPSVQPTKARDLQGTVVTQRSMAPLSLRDRKAPKMGPVPSFYILQ